jgi:hypothetical protein
MPKKSNGLHYLQAKVLLKPGRLSSLERFRNFGKLVHRTAKKMEVGLIDDSSLDQGPRIREIIFGDTPDFRLYKNGFILRRRIRYVDGFPAGDPEIVFKFRHPSLARAAAIDVRPRISGEYRIKFKLQTMPTDHRLGEYRSLYSHNCQFGVSQVHEGDRLAMSTLTRVFPALSTLKTSKGERVSLVNEGVVEELLLPLGKLDFGRGIVAKSSVALWRTRGEHVPVIGEYSFQVKFRNREDVPHGVEKRVIQFFTTLQRNVEDWIWHGTTKTGLVYRLKGQGLRTHE